MHGRLGPARRARKARALPSRRSVWKGTRDEKAWRKWRESNSPRRPCQSPRPVGSAVQHNRGGKPRNVVPSHEASHRIFDGLTLLNRKALLRPGKNREAQKERQENENDEDPTEAFPERTATWHELTSSMSLSQGWAGKERWCKDAPGSKTVSTRSTKNR